MVMLRRFIRSISSKAKAKKHKLKGNELVQAEVHVDGYHGTVDLMSTQCSLTSRCNTRCANRSMFVVSS